MKDYIHGALIALVLMLAACGGGGGGGGTTDLLPPPGPAPVPTSTDYASVALAGELLTYTLDTSKLTYSYTITDSAYGLNGKSGSGTLSKNTDGSYSPSGIPNAKVVVLPNGLLLGAIREVINGATTTIPVLGMSSPVTSIAAGAGIYNFVQRSCLSGACSSSYGTIQINADATWMSCPSGNIASGCTGSTYTGTLNSLGNGRWQVLQSGAGIGTAIAFNSNGQNVLILDLKDTRAGGFGVGMLVGSTQQAMATTQTDGTWVAAGTNGGWGVFNATGTMLAQQMMNGMPSTNTTTVTFNSPWVGMATTASGGHGLLAGTGVYAYENTGGYAEIGVKLN